MTRFLHGVFTTPFTRVDESQIIVRFATFMKCKNGALIANAVPKFSVVSTAFYGIHGTSDGRGGCINTQPPNGAKAVFNRTCMFDVTGKGYLVLRCSGNNAYDFVAEYISGSVTSDSSNSFLFKTGNSASFTHGNITNIRIPSTYWVYGAAAHTGNTFTSQYITVSRCQASYFLVTGGDTESLGQHALQKCNLVHNEHGNSERPLIEKYYGSMSIKECVFFGNDFATTIKGVASVVDCTFDVMVFVNVPIQSANENGFTGAVISHRVLDFPECYLEAAQTMHNRRLFFVKFGLVCHLLIN